MKIYDYADIHQPQLAKMFQKRQATYRKLHYKVAQINHDIPSFYKMEQACLQLEADMRNSHLVVVSVLYPSKEQICNLLNLLPNCCQMILKTVKQSEWLFALMNNKKVEIQFYEALYSDYLIIDGNLVWQSIISEYSARSG